MGDFGLFVGWSGPVRGREEGSSKVFGEAVALWTRLQNDGEIESWEAAFLEPHGGDLAGFFLIRGDRDNLARLRFSDDMLRLNIRAGHIVEGFGVVGAELGPRIESSMTDWLAAAAELT